MNRRPKHCCQSCATGLGGVCEAPVGRGQHEPVENWWSPRSAPDPSAFALQAHSAHMASLTARAGQYTNTLRGAPTSFFYADAPASRLGLIRTRPREARDVPPAQITLLGPRPMLPAVRNE